MKTLIELIPHPELPVSYTDKLKDEIIARMKALSLDKGSFKLDVKVLLWVCICLESSISKETKTNKKELALDIYRSVYGVSQADIDTISNNIDILHATKRIKKKHYFRLFLTSIREIFSL